MKICVFGAGAIGGNLATRLAAAGGHEISVVARGAQLQAIRTRGLTLTRNGHPTVSVGPLPATDRPSELAPQDLVLVTLKAQALPGVAAAIAGLLAPGAAAVFINNGIPWWWPYRGDPAAAPLPLLDPEGELWSRVGPQRALGCVAHSSNAVESPGMIHNAAFDQWILGEPVGGSSERCARVAEVFAAAGIRSSVSGDLRRDIWAKLLINASRGPIAALTRLTGLELSNDSELRAMMRSVMTETLAVALATGYDLRGEIDVEKIALGTGQPAGQRPSMLQDVLAHRPLEIVPVLGQVQAFGRQHQVATPVIDCVLPLVRGLSRWIAQGTATT
jgi:2-dehydropantoate 2-reductase